MLTDFETWSGPAATIIAVGALLVSIRALRYARASADAAQRQARVAEATLPPTPAVDWKTERSKAADRWLLINVGIRRAYGVRIRAKGGDVHVHGRKAIGILEPHVPVELSVVKHPGVRDVDELLVTWEGQPEPVPVHLSLRPHDGSYRPLFG